MTSTMKFNVAAILITAFSCSGQKSSTPQPASIDAEIAAARVVNEILHVNDLFNQAAETKDLNALLALYDTTEMYWLPPNSGRSMGMKSVRDNYSFITSTPAAKLWHVVDKIFVASSGDFASMMGSYHFRMIGNEGQGDDGKFFLMLAKQENRWRIKSDIYNSDFSETIEKRLVDKPNIHVHTHKSKSPGSVNAHLIITTNGIILIDALRTTSEAKQLVEVIKTFNRPLLAIIITHAHPDHFGGLQQISSEFPDVPIYASKDTRDDIATDRSGYIRSAKGFIGSDFGSRVPTPDKIVDSVLTIGSVKLNIDEIKHGEAESIITIHVDQTDILFSSDLINNQMIPYLVEGHTKAWLDHLSMYSRKFKSSTVVYPGHGIHGSLGDLVGFQENYIVTIHELIRNQLSHDPNFSNASKHKVIDSLNKIFVGLDYVTPSTELNMMNVQAVAKELRQGLDPK